MLALILRGLTAGFLIIAVTEIARRSPRLGSIMLFVPIAIPIVFVLMYWRDQNLATISRMSRDALALIPLSLPFFLPLSLAQRLQWPFWVALLAGLLLAAATLTVYLLLGPKSA